MIRNALSLALAILLTGFNIWTAASCGPLLWQAWGDISYDRIALLLLAGALSCSLANVWAHTMGLVRPHMYASQGPYGKGGTEPIQESADV